MKVYLLPPQVMFAAVANGYSVRVSYASPKAWLTIRRNGEEFCTILKGCSVEDAAFLLWKSVSAANGWNVCLA